MKKKSTIVFSIILLTLGISVLTYPMISSYVNKMHGSYAIASLQAQISQTEETELIQLRQQAIVYNQELKKGSEPENYDSVLDIAGGMMGHISIPRIQVELPIYHGVGEEVLAKGVGHMPQSALPVGGEGNHCVLTGHTGLPSAKLFTDLVKLDEGDLFYIAVLSDTLAYQVDQIKVVLPSESEELTAHPGKDYCTLVTCTPYGVNSHRLLVRGIRTDLPAENLIPQVSEPGGNHWLIILVITVMIAASVSFSFLYHKRKRYKYEKT